jgi:Domain of unknown function (DUF4276)
VKLVLLVEGYTERKAIPEFLKRWLDQQLGKPVGIQTVRFDGWQHLVRDAAQKTKMLMEAPKSDVIAVIGPLDLYGPNFYPPNKVSADERYEWAKQKLEADVDHPRYRQFFAVHETEAWLLSDSRICPRELQASVKAIQKPETVNFDEPPAKLLEKLYYQKYKRSYGKVTQGSNLFRKLDPLDAYNKCPSLQALLDEMLRLAAEAQP